MLFNNIVYNLTAVYNIFKDLFGFQTVFTTNKQTRDFCRSSEKINIEKV